MFSIPHPSSPGRGTALLLLALVTSGGVAIHNYRKAADVVVSADAPVGPFGSAAGPEYSILTPDV